MSVPDLVSLFTTNEVVDQMRVNDSIAGMIGYVEQIDSNLNSTRNHYYKFMLNNNHGRKVQVIAWKENIKKVELVTQLNQVVQVKSATVKIPKAANFNLGNTSFELQIQSNSTAVIHGMYEPEEEEEDYPTVYIPECADYVKQKICVSGHLKTAFAQFRYRNMNFCLGSIADIKTNYKLEMKSDADLSDVATKGQKIQVIGTVEHYPPGPICLRVDGVNSISCERNDDGQPIFTDFETLLRCYISTRK